MLRRLLLALAGLLVLLAIAVAVGLHFAAGTLRDKVREALGPESEIGEITLGWSAVEVRRVRVPAPRDWPAGDALRADRIVVSPDLAALFSDHQVRIRRIAVDQAYLSIYRTREGRLRLLPGMLEKKPAGDDAGKDGAGVPVAIDDVELSNSAVELFDASVAKPAHRLRLEQLHARLGPIHLPDLKGRTRLDVDGVPKGVRRDGKLTIAGWIELASKDSEIATRLQGGDLVALQPYLIKAAETGVKQGALDLDLKSTVKQNRLTAPGSVTLSNLELASGGGASATFMGMPRAAVVGMLKDRSGRISVQFTLEGRLDDPKFSLNEAFMMRVGTSVAEGLGISLESLARGASSTTQSLGSSLRKLFGK